jgi:tRNA (guanine-N7-)-methyltransferase
MACQAGRDDRRLARPGPLLFRRTLGGGCLDRPRARAEPQGHPSRTRSARCAWKRPAPACRRRSSGPRYEFDRLLAEARCPTAASMPGPPSPCRRRRLLKRPMSPGGSPASLRMSDDATRRTAATPTSAASCCARAASRKPSAASMNKACRAGASLSRRAARSRRRRSAVMRPHVLEIGCGMGETTAIIAAAHPQNDYLGIEVHTPGVGSLLKEIATRELTNLRVIQHDAVEVVRDMMAIRIAGRHPCLFPRSLAEEAPAEAAPDPAPFVALLASRLAPAATCIAPPTGRTMPTRCWRCSSAEPRLQNMANGFTPHRPTAGPSSKAAARARRLGPIGRKPANPARRRHRMMSVVPVHAPQLPGHRRSGRPPRDLPVDAAARRARLDSRASVVAGNLLLLIGLALFTSAASAFSPCGPGPGEPGRD